jgi:hypothetical protein
MKDKEFRPLLNEEWKKINSVQDHAFDDEDDDPIDITWNYYITEPFPSVWPATKDLYLIFYAYAEGFGVTSNIRDGVIVSAPWAKIDFNYIKQKVISKTILLKRIIPIGSQEIQAMEGKEIGAFEHAISLENFLLQKEEERSIKHLKDYYCLWIKHHKILFDKIMPLHKEFTSWLHKKC